MYDIFSHGRGRVLFEDTDLYGRAFPEARSKTTEHNIYERSKIYLDDETEKTQKLKKIEENKE